ncbi:transcription-repair coupling factor [Allohahella sp. A8]|uniref:transcription-repair coupling factor n=1 Tax=Allohahella sp. A8 TaxID=3141461 RepID=UPI003A810B1F
MTSTPSASRTTAKRKLDTALPFPLPREMPAGQAARWPILPGRADAMFLAQLEQQQPDTLTVVVTPDMATLERLEAGLDLFRRLDERDATPTLALPDWETLPYDSFSPHQDIVSRRIATLVSLPRQKGGLLLISVATLMQRLASRRHLLGTTLWIKKGDTIDIGSYREQLEQVGYRNVNTVFEHGEFAVRGAIIDLFPMGHDQPFRIELFDDEVDSLRYFDPETQRSGDQIDEIELLPAFEFPFDEAARSRFRQNFYEAFPESPRQTPVLRDVVEGIVTPGIEYYMPLFDADTSTLFDYLPPDSQLYLMPNLHARAEEFWADVQSRFDSLGHDRHRPLLPPHKLYLRPDELFAALARQPRIEVTPKADGEKAVVAELPAVGVETQQNQPLQKLIDAAGKDTVVLAAESAGRAEALKDLFAAHDQALLSAHSWQEALSRPGSWQVLTADIDRGFRLLDPPALLISESDLFELKVPQRRRRKQSATDTDALIQSLAELKEGMPVVHIEHGVGRFHGLVSLNVGDQEQEFILLVYGDDAKLYVPVAQLQVLSRYAGLNEEFAPLHKLGNDKWQKAKRAAREKIRDVASELLKIYARREARKGHSYKVEEIEYSRFADDFPFEETPDQASAIGAVVSDLKRQQPMDRLICGDVGFGKTEVAMRAAFLVANAGRQVVVLVPTTLLAQQHFNSFRDRFAGTAMRIELLSRFRSTQEIKTSMEAMKAGQVDIVIGTHKLIQKDVEFKDLGLLIIDEEHRFGVQQKERLKALRAEVDILTLTATPIPRTLNLSLQGVRDLSIIATPPERRLAVKTFVHEHEDGIVKEAVMRELLRGGQVFYLHNEVKTIQKTADALAELVPGARICVAHGQMPERQLEKVMSEFYHKKYNVLVCTTIIETGIDIPSANTIIIDRADKLGLAQLHQLRGRVGRSHHQAYAYLLTVSPRSLTADARKRLEAISAAQDLGAGFTLATHDLEIRGAGELLGAEQSGHINAIGFSLYMQLLDSAVRAMREGKELSLDDPEEKVCEVNLRAPALLPDSYIHDVQSRLVLYQRIAAAKSPEALKDLQVELIDRFGLLPDAAKNLFRQAAIRMEADQLGIVRIDAGEKGGVVEFAAKTRVQPMKLIELVQTKPKRYRLEGSQKLRDNVPLVDPEQRHQWAEQIVRMFA